MSDVSQDTCKAYIHGVLGCKALVINLVELFQLTVTVLIDYKRNGLVR